MRTVKTVFKPELLNRIDDLIVFHQLDREHIRRIVDLNLEDLSERLAEQNLTIEVHDAVKDKLASDGYDPIYGARPLRREIESQLENILAAKLINGELKKGDHVFVSLHEGAIAVTAQTLAPVTVPAPGHGTTN